MLASFDNRAGPKVIGLIALLVIANLLAWFWAWAAFYERPLLLASGLIAYGFGLRHAIDADHIAAIDNVTRKLMQEGRRPIAAGLCFSLGHSTVVFAASLIIAVTAADLRRRFPGLIEAGGVVGTLVSALFLGAIALANLVVLVNVYRLLRRIRRGHPHAGAELNAMPGGRAPFVGLLRGLFRLISRSWHMFPLGLLFGLGFDTATEIGLLGMAAAEACHELPVGSTLVFPALFTAGMSLVDGCDGVLMVGIYGWAFRNPLRKLYYNLAITAISVAVALLVGMTEALGLLAEKFGLEGALWASIGTAAAHWATLGSIVIVLFAATWLIAAAMHRAIGDGKPLDAASRHS